MAQFFHSWIFWFLLGLIIVHMVCKQSLKKDKERKMQQSVLWEHTTLEADATKNMKCKEAHFFNDSSDVYNQALDMIFSDNQTTVTIQGVQYKYKRNINAFKVYEKITNQRFTLSNPHNVYILMHCLLVVNNPNTNLRLDEFLNYVEEIEADLNNSEKSSKKS